MRRNISFQMPQRLVYAVWIVAVLLCCIVPVLGSSSLAYASSLDAEASPLLSEARLLLEPVPEQPGLTFRGVVELPLKPTWHTYWKNPGNIGMAPQFSWDLPKGVSVVSIDWPVPQQFASSSELSEDRAGQSEFISFGYSDTVRWLVTFRREAEFQEDGSSEENNRIRLALSWLACSPSSCIPQETEITADASTRSLDEMPQHELIRAIKSVKASLPRPDPFVKICVDERQGVLTLILPMKPEQHGDQKKRKAIVDSAYIFLEKEGVQSQAEGRIVLQGNGIPYGIRLLLPKNHIDALQQGKTLSGVYTYLMQDANGVGHMERISGEFSSAPIHFQPLRSSSASSPPIPATRSKEQRAQRDQTREAQHSEPRDRDAAFPAESFPSEESSSFMVYVGLAFLGGILLNCMPCVLPVVGLKILHLLSYRKNGESQSHSHRPYPFHALPYGLSFSLGVVTAFWALAIILYTLQYLGTSVGWGFQLQEPLFVVALILILFYMSLALFGLFELGTGISASAAAYETSDQKSEVQEGQGEEKKSASSKEKVRSRHMQSFMSGLLVTLIATPCTGPLLGSVLGFLATLHPLQGGVLFTALGLGVSAPYLMVTAFPWLLRWLPRPGQWMVTFKQFLGFCLLITIAWLTWVLHAQVDSVDINTYIIMLLSAAISSWIWGTWATPLRGRICRMAAYIASGMLFALSIVLAMLLVKPQAVELFFQSSDSRGIEWQEFSQKRLKENLSQGKTVLVEVTAKWCLTCQANKAVFLSKRLQDIVLERDVVLLRADWTKRDDAITEFLRSYGRNGVPVYILFSKGDSARPQILPELLTVDTVYNAILKATE